MDSENRNMEITIAIEDLNPDDWLKYEEQYKNFFLSPANRCKVPLLNANALHHLKDNRLVRFRGMIQDMHNPEFYFDTFEIVNKQTKDSRLSSGKYRDTADVGEDEALNYNSPNLKSAERQTMVTITLPGLNEWVQNLERELNHLPPLPSKEGLVNTSSNLKRSLEETEADDLEGMDTAEASSKDRNRSINQNAVPSSSSVSHEHILNFPLPESTGKVCLMKVYNEFESLKLNDMVEVVGFLSVDPILGNEWNGKKNEVTGEDMDVETLTHNPPPSLVPRIHAVHIEKLQHCNPLIQPDADPEKHLREANEAREHLRLTLTELLFGDSLAADYLICYLISCVYVRKDVLTLGKFSLNLSKIPAARHPQYSSCLYNILQLMVTKSYYLPLTVENMNTMAFLPKKDYECNRLTSGILQMSKNTYLVLDETKMEPGRLDSTGVSNLTALGDMIQTQKVKYDFKFYHMDHDCDIPVLILSEGKSLLPSDFHVPIMVDESNEAIVNEIFEAAKHYLMNNDVLHKVRVYLTSMQMATFIIEDEPQFIQEDFVEMRNNPDVSKQATAEDLHNLLVLTRLVGLSKGVNKLDRECWCIAKEMEETRKNRLSK